MFRLSNIGKIKFLQIIMNLQYNAQGDSNNIHNIHFYSEIRPTLKICLLFNNDFFFSFKNHKNIVFQKRQKKNMGLSGGKMVGQSVNSILNQNIFKFDLTKIILKLYELSVTSLDEELLKKTYQTLRSWALLKQPLVYNSLVRSSNCLDTPESLQKF